MRRIQFDCVLKAHNVLEEPDLVIDYMTQVGPSHQQKGEQSHTAVIVVKGLFFSDHRCRQQLLSLLEAVRQERMQPRQEDAEQVEKSRGFCDLDATNPLIQSVLWHLYDFYSSWKKPMNSDADDVRGLNTAAKEHSPRAH
ncbi:hypothetical protein E5288_WYG008164 [Bos mutus]|uniref:Uncharacterized protein n=1 Tax=Bos mutus TaxID=72004 RepID=A0A6B0S837_9CETA|nr:hypothetical protein [Bos mutus]